jgi:hypothetical protein
MPKNNRSTTSCALKSRKREAGRTRFKLNLAARHQPPLPLEHPFAAASSPPFPPPPSYPYNPPRHFAHCSLVCASFTLVSHSSSFFLASSYSPLAFSHSSAAFISARVASSMPLDTISKCAGSRACAGVKALYAVP